MFFQENLQYTNIWHIQDFENTIQFVIQYCLPFLHVKIKQRRGVHSIVYKSLYIGKCWFMHIFICFSLSIFIIITHTPCNDYGIKKYL